jgi:hypothetical protein
MAGIWAAPAHDSLTLQFASVIFPFAAATVTKAATGAGKYSWRDVAKHNTVDDCWVIVEGSVYNVTGEKTQLPLQPCRASRAKNGPAVAICACDDVKTPGWVV